MTAARLYDWTIKTTTGHRYEVTAPSPEDAIAQAGVNRAEVRRWYPMAVKAHPLPDEVKPMTEDTRARLRELRQSPEYKLKQELKRKIRRRVNGAHAMREKRGNMKIIKSDGSINAGAVFDTLATGEKQAVIPEAQRRRVPENRLKAKRPQTEVPLPLEMVEENKKQRRLF